MIRPYTAVRLSFLGFALLAFGGMAAATSQTPAKNEQSLDTLNQLDGEGRKNGFWRITAPVATKPGYADGQLIEEGRFATNKRIGTWHRYWPNGKLMSEITYDMGRPRGDYKTWYQNGQLEEEGNWDLDRNTGNFKRYHPNGEPQQDFVFNDYGVRDGVQKYYHENGQLAVQVNIEEGKEEGTLKRYYPNGDPQQVATFENGVVNAANNKFLRPVSKPATDLPKAEPAKTAPVVSATESVNPADRFNENGVNTLYDQQKRISQVGEFKNGQLWNGKRYRYDRDGKLQRIEVYDVGRYIGDTPITDEDKQ
ncbi:MAG: toxin-antitoxin system YwqK family antitoxin [Flavobacteriales bacterium]